MPSRDATVLRTLAKPMLALVLAAVATILVAVAACVWSYPWSTTTRVGDEALRKSQYVAERLDWSPMINSGPHGFDTVTCTIDRGLGFTHYAFTYERRDPPMIMDGRVIEWTVSTTAAATEYGWPLRCFIADNLSFAPRSSSRLQTGAVAEVQELLRKSHPLILPLAVDVVITWLAFWLLLVLPQRIRGMYRISQRRCAACGYPRGMSATTCSECGAPLPPEPPSGIKTA